MVQEQFEEYRRQVKQEFGGKEQTLPLYFNNEEVSAMSLYRSKPWLFYILNYDITDLNLGSLQFSWSIMQLNPLYCIKFKVWSNLALSKYLFYKIMI